MKTIIKEPDYMGKNERGFRRLCSLFMMLAGLLMLALTGDALAGGGGMTLGGIAAPGQVIVGETPTTDNVDAASPELLMQAVLKKVVQTHPSSFPLDTLMSHMPTQTTQSWKYRAYDTPHIPYYSTLGAACAAITNGTSNTNPFSITPGNIEHIRKWSCLFFPSIKGAATVDGLPLAMYVASVARGAGTIDVITLNATGGNIAAIANGTGFIIGPIAAYETDMQVEPQVPVPQSYDNYNQLFMCQMEIGDFEAAHLKEVGWDWGDIKDYAVMDFRTRRTISYYFGYASHFTDNIANVEKYSTGGIYRQISRKYPVPVAAWTDVDFIDFSKYVFVGAGGSRKKVVFAGDDLIANMSKAQFVQKQLQAANTEVAFGLTFSKIKTNFGDLLIHYEPLFTEMHIPNQSLVLDPEFIVRTNFNGVSYDKIDAKGAGLRRARIESIAEASSALLRNRDSHVWVE